MFTHITKIPTASNKYVRVDIEIVTDALGEKFPIIQASSMIDGINPREAYRRACRAARIADFIVNNDNGEGVVCSDGKSFEDYLKAVREVAEYCAEASAFSYNRIWRASREGITHHSRRLLFLQARTNFRQFNGNEIIRNGGRR
jgi:hypothetical protein